ncbi:MAG: hypothetical protein KDB27_11250, partial [Planctomycetales bacterium]|nr:hypothetical protein [Planctomycetales bacterium]
PLAAWFALCVRNGITAILGLAFLPACIFVAGATLLVLFGKPGQSRSDLAEGFSQIAGVFRFPFFCFYFGLACMQWRGFSIVTANRKDA